MNLDPNSIHRLLVIKLRAVGDVVLSTIVLRNLRLAFPHAAIDFLTEVPSAPVVQQNPDVSSVLVYDRHAMSGVALIRLVRARRYDAIIDLFGNPRSALVTRLSGARHRIGFTFRNRTYAYTIRVTPRGGQVHNTQFNLDALEAIGVPVRARVLAFPIQQDDRQRVATMLESAGLAAQPLVGLHAGGGWYTKRWGLEKFAALADRLIARYNVAIVIPWGPGERPEVDTIQSRMRERAFIPPATSLTELGAIFERCAFVVCNDSGPMHIAAAVGTPVAAIFGPTRPNLQGPYGTISTVVRREQLDCLGCNLTKCPIGNPCMQDLAVEDVFQAVESLVARIPRERFGHV